MTILDEFRALWLTLMLAPFLVLTSCQDASEGEVPRSSPDGNQNDALSTVKTLFVGAIAEASSRVVTEILAELPTWQSIAAESEVDATEFALDVHGQLMPRLELWLSREHGRLISVSLGGVEGTSQVGTLQIRALAELTVLRVREVMSSRLSENDLDRLFSCKELDTSAGSELTDRIANALRAAPAPAGGELENRG